MTRLVAVLACLLTVPVASCSDSDDATTEGESESAATVVAAAGGNGSGERRSPPCKRKVASVSKARQAVAAASPGATICLQAGSYGAVDLTNIDKPVKNRVTFRGVGKRRTRISGLHWAGSSGLVVENLRSTRDVDGAQQYSAHHLTFRYMDVSSPSDGFRGIGSWGDSGQHHIVIERNYIHDTGEYAIRAQGNAPDWTIRRNRFERIREDYIQTGQPSGWVVDHNVMGPGDFDRPSGYGGHPDIWQSLDSGNRLRFTNNLVRNTNQSLGFIFGAISDYSGYDHVVVRNNLFVDVVYGVGETCQFSPGRGYVFEQNTLIGSRGCRWGGGEGDPWPDGSDYSIKRNILSGGSYLSCNDTSSSNSCRAFEKGTAKNVRGFKKWAGRCYFKPRGLPKKVGARLSSRDFRGYPFRASCPGTRAGAAGTEVAEAWADDVLSGVRAVAR